MAMILPPSRQASQESYEAFLGPDDDRRVEGIAQQALAPPEEAPRQGWGEWIVGGFNRLLGRQQPQAPVQQPADPASAIRAELGLPLSTQTDALIQRISTDVSFTTVFSAPTDRERLEITLLVFMKAFRNHLERNKSTLSDERYLGEFTSHLRTGSPEELELICTELTRKLMISLSLDSPPAGFDRDLLQRMLPKLLKEVVIPNLRDNPTKLLTSILKEAKAGSLTGTFSKIGTEFSVKMLTSDFQKAHPRTAKALNEAFGNAFKTCVVSMNTDNLLLAAISAPSAQSDEEDEALAVTVKDILFPKSMGFWGTLWRYWTVSNKFKLFPSTDDKMKLSRILATNLKAAVQGAAPKIACAVLHVVECTT